MPLEDYEEIVTHFDAPTLVLAGPGAGKTYLLADRITRLLDDDVDKDNITVLTFGRDANTCAQFKKNEKQDIRDIWNHSDSNIHELYGPGLSY